MKPNKQKQMMKNSTFFFLATIGLCILGAFAPISQNSQLNSDDSIHWLSIEEAEELNKENPKKMMVFFYTDWCGYCKQMERTVFKDPAVVNSLNEEFYAIKFNAEQRESVEFDGVQYSFEDDGGSGINGLAKDMLLGKKIMPTLVFLDEDKTAIRRLVGVQPIELFSIFLNYLSGNHYLNEEWYEYSNQE